VRVLFLSTSGQLGGAERVLLDMVRVCATMPGGRASVVLPQAGPLGEAVAEAGGEPLLLPLPGSLARLGEARRGTLHTALSAAGAGLSAARYSARLRAVVDRWAPDIVHANGIKMQVLAARLGVKPLVWHLHDYVGRRRISAMLLRHYSPRPACIVAPSEDAASDARRSLKRPVQALPNGVDVARFRPDGPLADLDAAAGLPTAPDVVRVGLVATYARWKGHDTFLRAVAALPGDLRVRAYVIGGPLYGRAASELSRAELVTAARAAGVESRIAFIDFQRDLAPVYRALDVVVHASTDPEPFGLVVAEAMACGKAVVAGDRGGVNEIVTPGCARPHRSGDAGDLARAIAALAADPTQRALLGDCARRRVLEHFSLDRFRSRLLDVYNELAAGRVPLVAASQPI
jgi:glycosyltransferase involved in cell wall biosynthesis